MAEIILSIVIPAYNEEANLEETLKEIGRLLKNQGLNYEVIIVDDASFDKTSAIASSCRALFANFLLLKNETNRGKGYSVKKGVLASHGELILFMDADNSTRINQIDKLMAALKDGSDIAIGSRRVKGSSVKRSQPLYRIIPGNAYILLCHLLLGITAKDINCGFKLFKKKAAMVLFPMLIREDWSFDSELLFLSKKLGFQLKEVPITWEDKKSTSKVKPFKDGLRSFLDLFRIKFHSY
jgi:dolichyl-phosphate beta-glucosyltransferase